MLGRELWVGAVLCPLQCGRMGSCSSLRTPAHFPQVIGSCFFLATHQSRQFMALLPAKEKYAVPSRLAATGEMSSAASCLCAAFL